MIKVPRLTLCLLISVVLMVIAYLFREFDPVVSVSLYKAHLMSLGGWGGYWLDRAVFPYSRPHLYASRNGDDDPDERVVLHIVSCIRRAIIIAAALICVGIGA